jgi:hypothetical protein
VCVCGVVVQFSSSRAQVANLSLGCASVEPGTAMAETYTRWFFSQCPLHDECSSKVAVCTYPECCDIAPSMDIVQTAD